MSLVFLSRSESAKSLPPCDVDAIDALLALVSIAMVVLADRVIAIMDYPDHQWPNHAGTAAAAQIAGWMLLGSFVAGPFILARQRWLKGRAEPLDISEQSWFWTPIFWVTLVVASRLLTEIGPLGLLFFGAINLGLPVMIIAGFISIWRSARGTRKREARWTSALATGVTMGVALWGIAVLYLSPVAL